MITVTGPKSLSLPASMGGNDATFGLVLVATSRGLIVESIGDQFQVKGITDLDLLSIDIVRLLVSLGADVLGYKVWFEMPSPDAECPLFPAREFDKVLRLPTWQEAFGALHPPRKVGEQWFQNNEVTQSPNDGEPLPASRWINSGVKFITVAEMHALESISNPKFK